MHAGRSVELHVERARPSARGWPMAYNYWFGFVGNVLGMARRDDGGEWVDLSGRLERRAVCGCSGGTTGNGGQDPYLDGRDRFLHLPAWRLRLCQWLDSRLDVRILADAAEFVLFEQPAVVLRRVGANCTYPWPWVTPTGSTPIQSPTGSGGSRSARQGALGRRNAVRAALSRPWRRLKRAGADDLHCRQLGARHRSS